MTTPVVRNDSPIERERSAAIRQEIGDRLRVSLARQPNVPLPEHMMMLVNEMTADQPLALYPNQKLEAVQ
jgi:hypothetical protein